MCSQYKTNFSIVYLLSIEVSNEVTDHQGQWQHEHLHAITCKLAVLTAIHIEVIEMTSVLKGGSDHRRVSYNSREVVCQAFPHSQALVMMGLPLEESRSGLHITKEQVDFLDERLYVPDL